MSENCPSRTVSLGAVFDADGLCYLCRHTDDLHVSTRTLVCECCEQEARRRSSNGPSDD